MKRTVLRILAALALLAFVGCYSLKTIERVYHNGQWEEKPKIEKEAK